MSSRLAILQDAFQDRLLCGSDAILEHLGETGGRLLGAYDHAYTARLLDVMAADFEGVHTLLGDADFASAVRAYLAARPSRHRNIRWIGTAFPAWLGETAPWVGVPMLAEMAAFEWALGLAFDAPDAVPLAPDALAAVPPPAWAGLRFDPHPALSFVVTAYSVVPFHQAVAAGADPDGPPEELAAPVTWAVWREAETLQVTYRALAPDEAAVAATMARGGTFADMGEAAAEAGDADDAAVRVAGYLRGWIDAGWIAGLAEDGISR